MTPVPKIILASASPRRRELLAEAGYDFVVRPPSSEAEASAPETSVPEKIVTVLAYRKAADVAARCTAQDRGAIIVACDTIVACAGRILGKPADRDDAAAMLRLLRGEEHHVYSGLCVWPLPGGPPDLRVARTTLHMDQITDAELEDYLDSGAWQGKAGGFGYQDRLGWVHVVEGSETNVVGLPMELLAEMLVELDDPSVK
jgi:septum formation protein